MKNISNSPKVSIITCVLNGEKYISKLLDSVLNMGYPNIEHIIVNDGSTDGTENIILKYKKLYESKPNTHLTIKYIKQENMGLGGATNTGLKEITGEYWTWINCDDWYLPNAFNKCIDFFNKKKCDVILLNHRTYSYKENTYIDEKKESFARCAKLILKSRGNFKFYFLRSCFRFCHFICKTNAYREINPSLQIVPYRYTQDVQLLVHISFLKCRLYSKALTVFLRRNDNLYKTNESSFNSYDISKLKISSLENLAINNSSKKSILNLIQIYDSAYSALCWAYGYNKDNFLINFEIYKKCYDKQSKYVKKEHSKYLCKKPMIFYKTRNFKFIWIILTHIFLFNTKH